MTVLLTVYRNESVLLSDSCKTLGSPLIGENPGIAYWSLMHLPRKQPFRRVYTNSVTYRISSRPIRLDVGLSLHYCKRISEDGVGQPCRITRSLDGEPCFLNRFAYRQSSEQAFINFLGKVTGWLVVH
jgi:hypothetical protein